MLRRFLIFVILTTSACAPAPPTMPPAPLPTYDLRDVTSLCADLNATWGSDWARVVDDLEKMRLQAGTCNGDDPAQKLYPAYFNYGAWLEARGNISDALKQYQNALSVNPNGVEAAKALQKRNALTPQPLPTCTDDQVREALAAVPAYTPQLKDDFVRAQGSTFAVGDQPYHVRGINYYPARAPWRRFLTDSDLDVVAHEFDLMHDAGFNALRIFLWYDGLFDCPGSGAIPKPDMLARLDGIIKLAAQRELRLIVTLNDLPDLVIHPLYFDPDSAAEQTAYIVGRYRDEPAILAWDVRNEGDTDYTRNGFSSSAVLGWLKQTIAQIRKIDHSHMITAGWYDGTPTTESSVDFVSFHHYAGAQALGARTLALRAYTKKPILLEEVGYSTLGVSEADQGTLLHDTLSAADSDGLAGWMIWTAFDFPTDVACDPPACPATDSSELHFGLWHADYTPKAAVGVIRAMIAP